MNEEYQEVPKNSGSSPEKQGFPPYVDPYPLPLQQLDQPNDDGKGLEDVREALNDEVISDELRDGCDAAELTHNPDFDKLPATTKLSSDFLINARFLRALTDGDSTYLLSLGLTRKQIKKFKHNEVEMLLGRGNGQLTARFLPLDELNGSAWEEMITLGTENATNRENPNQIPQIQQEPVKQKKFSLFKSIAGHMHTHPLENKLGLLSHFLRKVSTVQSRVEEIARPSFTDIVQTANNATGIVEVVLTHSKVYILVKTAQSISVEESEFSELDERSLQRITSDIDALQSRENQSLGAKLRKRLGKSHEDIKHVTDADVDNTIINATNEECSRLYVGLYEADWNPKKEQTEPLVLRRVTPQEPVVV